MRPSVWIQLFSSLGLKHPLLGTFFNTNSGWVPSCPPPHLVVQFAVFLFEHLLIRVLVKSDSLDLRLNDPIKPSLTCVLKRTSVRMSSSCTFYNMETITYLLDIFLTYLSNKSSYVTNNIKCRCKPCEWATCTIPGHMNWSKCGIHFINLI